MFTKGYQQSIINTMVFIAWRRLKITHRSRLPRSPDRIDSHPRPQERKSFPFVTFSCWPVAAKPLTKHFTYILLCEIYFEAFPRVAPRLKRRDQYAIFQCRRAAARGAIIRRGQKRVTSGGSTSSDGDAAAAEIQMNYGLTTFLFSY